jgi:hypothetical protein
LPYVGVYYLLFFGLPIFAAPLAFRVGDNVVLYHRIVLATLGPDVVLLAAVGIGAMIAAYYLAQRRLFSAVPKFRLPDPKPPAGVLNLIYAVLLTASLAYRYSPPLQALPSIGQLLDPVGYLALGGFYLQWRAGRLPRALGWLVLLVALPLDLYMRIRHVFITDILLLPLFFAFILWRERQLKTITIVAAVASILALSYTVTAGSRFPDSSLLKNFQMMGDYLSSAIKGERVVHTRAGIGDVVSDPRISRLVNRLGQIWIFQTVYERSPEPVPYLGGETYRPLLTSFIPRVLYPDKPLEKAGASFGLRYGFTEADATNTSFNIPWIVELLANFGPPGVLIGMTLLGLLLGLLNRVFNAEGMSDLEFLIGLTIIFRLGYQESNLSVMTGSLLPLFVALYVLFAFGPKVLSALNRSAP